MTPAAKYRIEKPFCRILRDYAIVWRGKIGYDDALDVLVALNQDCCPRLMFERPRFSLGEAT